MLTRQHALKMHEQKTDWHPMGSGFGATASGISQVLRPKTYDSFDTSIAFHSLSLLFANGVLHSRHLLPKRQDIGQRPDRRNRKLIDLLVALCVVVADMLKLGRLAKGRHIPVEVAQPGVDGRVAAADVADVALEVLDVDGVEAHDGGVQAHVGFGDGVAEVEGPGARAQVLLHAVQACEELLDVALVCVLRRCKAALVHAVVDVVVCPCVRLFDLLLQVLWEQHHVAVFLGQHVVELGVEHADYFGGFIRHNGLVLLVVEQWYREPPGVIGIDAEVDISQMSSVGMQRIWRYVLSW